MSKQVLRYSRVARFAALALAFCTAPAVAAPTYVFNGIVRHVSAGNIKVYNPRSQKTMGFALAPHFHNVFKGGSKTAQLSTIAAGQYVKVYYNRRLLGAAFAKSIYLLDQNNRAFGRT